MRPIIITLLIATFMVAGCSTIVNPFSRMTPDYANLPQDALRSAAMQIEKNVLEGNKEAPLPEINNISINTPEIQQAVRTRAARAALVKKFLDSGFGSELKSGLLNIERTSAYKKSTSKKERDRNALLVMSENADRWTLYEGILNAGKFPQRSLSAIQDTFHQVRVEMLAPGQKYEDQDGKMQTKAQ